MVNIVTNAPTNRGVIRGVDTFFDAMISASYFSDDELDVIRRIDSAELLDVKTGVVETPFGVCSIRNLSTGCKTVLIYLYMQSKYCDKEIKTRVLDISECGANALRVLFECVQKRNDEDSIFLLRQFTQIGEFIDTPAIINGKRCDSIFWELM